jgi:hypothetical protein
MGWGRVRTTVGAALLGAALVGLGAFLASRGLDGADKWAGVVSAFVGVAGLVVAVLSLRQGRAGGGRRASVDAGHVDGEVTGVRGPAGPHTADVAVTVRTKNVRRGGSVTGLDLTAPGAGPSGRPLGPAGGAPDHADRPDE